MNRVSNYFELENRVVQWLKDYVELNFSIKAFVVGVSGGIDSAVCSTLAAKTGLPVYAIGMPIHQHSEQENLSDAHLEWLRNNFSNVITEKYDLTKLFEIFKFSVNQFGKDQHALANSRSRLRMVTLYQVATSVNGIVVGTGNKVEDYGVGFYTKYGDGGVDIAPIADLYKTEVWELGKHLGVDPRIVSAAPTDGLWDDGRTDEDQIEVSYEMLEWVMDSQMFDYVKDPSLLTMWKGKEFTEEEKKAIQQYQKFNRQNKHKMNPIPTFKL